MTRRVARAILDFLVPSAQADALVVVGTGTGTGFGTSAPAAPIHVQRADNTAEVRVEDTGAGLSTMFRLRNNGSILFRMENAELRDRLEHESTELRDRLEQLESMLLSSM